MPRVPVYDQNVVRQAAIPGVGAGPSAGAESFGARTGRSLQQFGAGVMDLAALMQVRKEKAEQVQTRSLLNQAQLDAMESMKGNVLSRKGLEAVDADQVATQAMDDIRKKYVQQLKSERQRQMFEASFGEIATSNIAHAMGHRDAEVDKAQAETRASHNQLAVDNAAFYRDANSIQQAEATISYNTAADLRGMGEDTIRLQTSKAIAAMHSQVISDIYTGDGPEKAKAYLEAHGSKFAPEQAEKIRKAIEKDLAQKQAETVAAGISGKSLEEQANAIAGIKDADQKKEVERLVSIDNANRDAAAKQKAQQAQESRRSSWLDTLAKNPKAVVPANVPVEDRVWMQAQQDDVVRRMGTGEKKATDWRVYDHVRAAILKNPDAPEANAINFADKLEDGQMKQLIDMRQDAQNVAAGGKAKPEYLKLQSDMEVIDGALLAHGVGKKTDPVRYASLVSKIEREVNKRKPKDREQFERVLGDLLISGNVVYEYRVPQSSGMMPSFTNAFGEEMTPSFYKDAFGNSTAPYLTPPSSAGSVDSKTKDVAGPSLMAIEVPEFAASRVVGAGSAPVNFRFDATDQAHRTRVGEVNKITIPQDAQWDGERNAYRIPLPGGGFRNVYSDGRAPTITPPAKEGK